MPSASRTLCSLLLFASAGCVWGPTNGDVVSQDVQSHTISVSGFLAQPVSRVRVEALSPPDQDPFSPTATWVDIGDEVESANVPIGFGYDGLYFWAVSLDMDEIMPQLSDDIWRQGGLLRLRAYDVDTGTRLFTFDSQDCVLDHLGEPVIDVINACQSEDLPVVTVLSDYTIGRPVDGKYLVRKLNDPNAAAFAPSQFALGVDYLEEFGTVDGAPLQFGVWMKRHHLDLNDDVTAKYFNGSDLALGRDMHCRHVLACESGEVCFDDPSADCTEILRTACYVTNYGEPGGSASDAFEDMANGQPVASVGMEKHYHDPEATDCQAALASPVPAVDDVRYFVWPQDGGSLEDDEPISAVRLVDGQDAQAIPGLCVNCHGGQIDSVSGIPKVTNSKFLPFDIDAFDYGDTPETSKVEQLDAFRQLNEIVLDTELEGATDLEAESTIADLIIHWYGGVEAGEALVRSSGSYSDDVPPPGWEGEERLYQEVVTPYCRMCHAAFDEQSFTFADYANFQAAGLAPANKVCLDHQMPQSRVTAENMWRGSARMVLVNELEFTGPGGAVQRWTNDCAPTIYP